MMRMAWAPDIRKVDGLRGLFDREVETGVGKGLVAQGVMPPFLGAVTPPTRRGLAGMGFVRPVLRHKAGSSRTSVSQ